MKIQINSLEALERLIGGDTELEFQIRNSIVQEFAKKHLKAIAKDLLDKSITTGVEKFIKDEFFEVSRWDNVVSFNTKTRESLLSNLNNDARRAFDELVREALEFDKIKQIVQERLTVTSAYIDDQLKPEILNRRLNEMVDKRIKERLGVK